MSLCAAGATQKMPRPILVLVDPTSTVATRFKSVRALEDFCARLRAVVDCGGPPRHTAAHVARLRAQIELLEPQIEEVRREQRQAPAADEVDGAWPARRADVAEFLNRVLDRAGPEWIGARAMRDFPGCADAVERAAAKRASVATKMPSQIMVLVDPKSNVATRFQRVEDLEDYCARLRSIVNGDGPLRYSDAYVAELRASLELLEPQLECVRREQHQAPSAREANLVDRVAFLRSVVSELQTWGGTDAATASAAIDACRRHIETSSATLASLRADAAAAPAQEPAAKRACVDAAPASPVTKAECEAVYEYMVLEKCVAAAREAVAVMEADPQHPCRVRSDAGAGWLARGDFSAVVDVDRAVRAATAAAAAGPQTGALVGVVDWPALDAASGALVRSAAAHAAETGSAECAFSIWTAAVLDHLRAS